MTSIGEYFDGVRIRGIDEGIGRDGIVQSFVATPADGSLELPTGPAGPAGDPGPAGYRIRWEGDIADDTALQALATTLREVHAGKAWRVRATNALMIWNGRTFDTHPDAFGAHGPQGQPNTLTLGTVTTGAAGSDVQVTVTGDSPGQTVDLVLPRGVEGAEGPAGSPGPITDAPDFDDAPALIDCMVPLWNAGSELWVPTAYPGWRGPWMIREAQAWDGGPGFAASQNNISTSPNLIATLNIPAQDTAWRPVVFGSVIVRNLVSNNDSNISLRARIGGTGGQQVARGASFGGNLDNPCRLTPHFAATFAPDSSVGVIAAGVPASIAITLEHGTVTAANYNWSRVGAFVTAFAVPVTGLPA